MVTRVQQALQSAAGAAGGGFGNYNIDVTTINNIDTELNGGMTFQPSNTNANWLGFWLDPSDGKTFYTVNYGQNRFQKWTSSSSDPFPTSNWTCGNVNGSQLDPNVGTSTSLGNLGHIQFWDGGSRMMLTSIDGADVYGYSLSTDYTLNTDASGITRDWSDTSFGSKVGASGGLGWVCMAEDGTRALAKGYAASANIYRSSTLTNGNLTASGVSWTNTNFITEFSIGGATVSPDGRFLYDMEYNGGKLVKIDAGEGNTLWDSATSGWTKTSSAANTLDKPGPGYGNGTIQFDWENKAGVPDHADGTPQIRAFVTYMNTVDAVVYGNVKLVT